MKSPSLFDELPIENWYFPYCHGRFEIFVVPKHVVWRRMLHQSLAPQELACDAEVTALSKNWQQAMLCYRSRVDGTQMNSYAQEALHRNRLVTPKKIEQSWTFNHHYFNRILMDHLVWRLLYACFMCFSPNISGRCSVDFLSWEMITHFHAGRTM